MELTKTDNEYINLVLSSIRTHNSFLRLSKTNRESLMEMVKYIYKLNQQNILDEEQFRELIVLACANFIENEVELRIERSFNNKIMYFFEKK